MVDVTVFLKCKDYGEKKGLMNKTLPVVFFFFFFNVELSSGAPNPLLGQNHSMVAQ